LPYLKQLPIDDLIPFSYNILIYTEGRRIVMDKEEKQVKKQSNEQPVNNKMKDIPKDAWIVGPEYDFWWNEKDDVYDELYKDV
jgi:hypothetical protein